MDHYMLNWWQENCEAQHESCSFNGECFDKLTNDRLPINPKDNVIFGGRQKEDSPKLCYDEYSDNAKAAYLKMVGGTPEAYIWPWMYQIKGKNSDGDFFCTANQIGRHLLVTGKI